MDTPTAGEATNSVRRIGYTVRELAKAVGVHPTTLRTRINSKQIIATRFGRQFIIPASEVKRLFGDVPTLAG